MSMPEWRWLMNFLINIRYNPDGARSTPLASLRDTASRARASTKEALASARVARLRLVGALDIVEGTEEDLALRLVVAHGRDDALQALVALVGAHVLAAGPRSPPAALGRRTPTSSGARSRWPLGTACTS